MFETHSQMFAAMGKHLRDFELKVCQLQSDVSVNVNLFLFVLM